MGTLEITENGTYDVSGYSEVVVDVDIDTSDEVPLGEEQVEFELQRVRFKGFSMEVPSSFVEDYTETELSDGSAVTLHAPNPDGTTRGSLYISSYDSYGLITLEDWSDAPREDVNGITMAIGHSHPGDMREVTVEFIESDRFYSLQFTYPVSQEELYADYSDQFYHTIEFD